ncbi:MAG: hypothetical protein LBJ31_10430 [Treponema sp.]|jgi:hypothetical protein|nr:hypothetical protein [Treponema sp.]
MKRHLALVLSVIVLGTAPLGAATVSFLVIETGLPMNGEIASSSKVWENGLLDAFFDGGHIVSNARLLRLEDDGTLKKSGALPAVVKADFDDAREGGADFFVAAFLRYAGDDHEQPQEVFLKLYDMNGILVYEFSSIGRTFANPRDEFIDAKRIASKLIPLVKR